MTQRRQACTDGDGDACNSLGVDYAHGHGVARDEAGAAALYRRGCEAGSAVACNNLGKAYEDGKGVTLDAAQAVAFYRRACGGGLPLGCERLRRIPGGDPTAQPPPAPFDGLYRGHVGGKKVLVLVEGTDADPRFWGRYAYLHVGAPIGLDGKLQGSAAVVEETPTGDDPGTKSGNATRGRWSGAFSPVGFRGEWSNGDGTRRHPIELSREVRAPIKGDALDPGRSALPSLEDAFYGELARLNLITHEREVVVDGVAYRMVSQTRADVAYPRLTRHPDKSVLTRVNADLERRHLSDVSDALACLPSACRHCEYDEQLDVALFSRDFLSLWIAGAGTCGGPIFDWTDSVTYDLKTGEPIDLNKEFQLSTAAGALSERFLPIFMRHVRAAGPETPTEADVAGCYGTDGEEDQEMGDQEVRYHTRLALTAKGLRVRTDFESRMASGCEAEATIPYGELARFRRKDSPHRFGAEPR